MSKLSVVVAEDEVIAITFKATKAEKFAWQAKAKLEGTDLSKQIRESMNAWLGGMTLSDAEREKAEEEEFAEMQKMAELLNDASSWPVGEVRKVEKTEVRAGNIPPTVVWVDEVGNWFDKNMNLLCKDGKDDIRAGGGTLLWELTWQPALLSGWRPRADDHSFFTNDTYKRVVRSMQGLGRLPKDFELTKKEN